MMNSKIISTFLMCLLFSGFTWAQELEVPQYEKPSPEFLKIFPLTTGVSYFSCGNDAKSYEARPSPEDCETLKKNDGKFIKKTDINKNGIQETLLVGRFLDSNGDSGTFLQIIEGNEITILCSGEYQNYSFLDDYNGNVIWAWCYDCGAFSEILWKDGRFVDYSPFNEF